MRPSVIDRPPLPTLTPFQSPIWTFCVKKPAGHRVGKGSLVRGWAGGNAVTKYADAKSWFRCRQCWSNDPIKSATKRHL